MDARKQIEQSFKELVSSLPFEKITVRMICERAHVSRKTFYTLFENKESIITSLFNRDVITPTENLRTLIVGMDLKKDARNLSLMIVERLYQSLYDQRDFYLPIVRNDLWPESYFLKLVTTNIHAINLQILDEFGFEGTPVEKDYTAYFFAASQALIMQKWLRDGMPMTPKQLTRIYTEWVIGFWRHILGR
jgi:AcrR family transcriptional regulator